MPPVRLGLITPLILLLAACQGAHQEAAKPTKPVITIPTELGGDNSVDVVSTNAFSLPSPNMPFTERLNFSVGNSFFRNAWVIAPSTTTARDGLGPLFNTSACQNCHIKDGRGHLPVDHNDNTVSMLVRVSVPGTPATAADGIVAHPTYGGQLQDFAINGYTPEVKIQFDFDHSIVTLADGTEVELRKPQLLLSDFSHGDIGSDALTSVRIAPPMIGLGYLEALTEEQLLAQADPDDADGDGISGRANRVWDTVNSQLALGRFGWKAEQPTLQQQNAGAFAGDMGLTSALNRSDDCTQPQTECRQAANGGDPEVSDDILAKVTFYTHNLAVPKRRNSDDPGVIAGGALFQTIGCSDCHTPKWQVGEVPEMPWLANQTIYPFTDMLLHDMGDALSDHRPVYAAAGDEWRTQPLWGLGLTSAVNGEFGFMHDGRARTITEAILWHGGEAESSRTNFVGLSTDQRNQLLAFLNSL
ncbi:di-heme oxidoredictase family protein [Halioxenophilus sp. WMMB6]|uniref:di-heme oxidoreductase family protein n=1 Tax=Halioxenophilus sp. WMMB6 TaxID=3073815 RepID=UPI00295E699C|nr:di-heme oxidoredictase family protein [Halioxenophilus sp. WMMB6]